MKQEKGPSIVAQELAWLDRLRAALEPNVAPAVATLVHLSQNSGREQVKAMAAAKIVGLYAQCAADSAKLKLSDKGTESENEDNVRVLVVSHEQLGEASQRLAAGYQAKRLLAKDAG